MNLFADAFEWIFSADRATGALPLTSAIWSHVWISLVAVAIAAAIAIPIGWAVGHTGRGRDLAVAVTGSARAVPSFGLVLLLVLVFGVAHKIPAILVALVLLAIPPILAGAYSGIESIKPDVLDGARAMGMTGRQVLGRVEIPLGLPLLLGGLRSAVLQVVATVTIAGYVGPWGLGFPLIQGIALRDYGQILGASLVIVALAIALDGVFALLQRVAVPAGVRARSTATG